MLNKHLKIGSSLAKGLECMLVRRKLSTSSGRESDGYHGTLALTNYGGGVAFGSVQLMPPRRRHRPHGRRTPAPAGSSRLRPIRGARVDTGAPHRRAQT